MDEQGPTAEQAREQVEQRRAELHRRLEAAATAREAITAVRVRRTSPDGLVTVEVSARGTLLDLRLTPGSLQLGADALARQVLATVRTATAGAAEQVRAVLEPTVAPGTDLDALVLDPAAPREEPAGHDDAPRAVVDDDALEDVSWLQSSGGGTR